MSFFATHQRTWYQAQRKLLSVLNKAINYHLSELREALCFNDVTYDYYPLTTYWIGGLDWPQSVVRSHYDELCQYVDMHRTIQKKKYRIHITNAQATEMENKAIEIQNELRAWES